MIDLKTYKGKFYGAIIAFSVILILAFPLAFNKTIETSKQNKQISLQVKEAENAHQQIALLREKSKSINTLIGSEQGDNHHLTVLEICSEYSSKNQVTVNSYPKEHVYKQNEISIGTNIITMEGKFKSLVNLLFRLEKQTNIGKAVSTDFYLIQDRSLRTEKLMMTVYLQNIKSTNNEE